MSKFVVRYGFPKIHNLMASLKEQLTKGTISKADRRQLKKLVKCFQLLGENPLHPGLKSHEITSLSAKYKLKVFQSYLENKAPSAGRVFWIYGPHKGEITICAIEPHPKKSSYSRVKLALDPKPDGDLL